MPGHQPKDCVLRGQGLKVRGEFTTIRCLRSERTDLRATGVVVESVLIVGKPTKDPPRDNLLPSRQRGGQAVRTLQVGMPSEQQEQIVSALDLLPVNHLCPLVEDKDLRNVWPRGVDTSMNFHGP